MYKRIKENNSLVKRILLLVVYCVTLGDLFNELYKLVYIFLICPINPIVSNRVDSKLIKLLTTYEKLTIISQSPWVSGKVMSMQNGSRTMPIIVLVPAGWGEDWSGGSGERRLLRSSEFHLFSSHSHPYSLSRSVLLSSFAEPRRRYANSSRHASNRRAPIMH